MSQDNEPSRDSRLEWHVQVRSCTEGWCAAPIKYKGRAQGMDELHVDELPVEIFPGESEDYVRGYAHKWQEELNSEPASMGGVAMVVDCGNQMDAMELKLDAIEDKIDTLLNKSGCRYGPAQ